MGYHDLDRAGEPPPDTPLALARAVLSVAVRVLGLALLLLGLWVGAKVIIEAWALYEQPERIERLAAAVEQGSNLDRVFAAGARRDAVTAEESAAAARDAGELRLSYFAAWFVALILLAVIGGLALAAVGTGGRLALHDLEQPRIRREVERVLKGGR